MDSLYADSYLRALSLRVLGIRVLIVLKSL